MENMDKKTETQDVSSATIENIDDFLPLPGADSVVTTEEDEAFKSLEPKPSDPTLHCFMCGTELIIAPGIGPFCPNKSCDVTDEKSKSVLEQHPYLSKPFVSFDTKPMVAKIRMLF